MTSLRPRSCEDCLRCIARGMLSSNTDAAAAAAAAACCAAIGLLGGGGLGGGGGGDLHKVTRHTLHQK
jgi:Potassium channel Kv1.4 tandem inactivation domain